MYLFMVLTLFARLYYYDLLEGIGLILVLHTCYPSSFFFFFFL